MQGSRYVVENSYETATLGATAAAVYEVLLFVGGKRARSPAAGSVCGCLMNYYRFAGAFS